MQSTMTMSSSLPGRTLGPQVCKALYFPWPGVCSCRAEAQAQGMALSGATLGSLEGPGPLSAKRSTELWRKDVAGQVGKL